MEHYERKLEILYMIQGGRCFLTGKPLADREECCRGDKVDMHHAGIPSSKWARRLWPLLIDSILNLTLVLANDHSTKPLPPRWPDKKRRDLEAHLEANPHLADTVNGRAEVYDIGQLKELWWNTWLECWPESKGRKVS